MPFYLLQYEHVSQHVQGCDACARSPEFCDPSVGCELQSPTLAQYPHPQGAATGFQDQFSSYSRGTVSPTPHSLDCSSDESASASDHVKMLRIGRAGSTMYEVESSRRRTRLRAAVNSG